MTEENTSTATAYPSRHPVEGPAGTTVTTLNRDPVLRRGPQAPLTPVRRSNAASIAATFFGSVVL
jgi:hypothetical protein